MSDNTYTLPVACLNCDWEGSITLQKGEQFQGVTKINRQECPHCGCATLTKRHLPKMDFDKFWMIQDLGDDRMLCVRNYTEDTQLAKVGN